MASPSPAETIADAVVSFLNGLSLTMPFHAEKPENPQVIREALRALDVQVIPSTETEDQVTRRGAVRLEIEVNVLINRTLDDGTTRADCQNVVYEMREALRHEKQASYTPIAIGINPLWDLPSKQEHNQFVSKLTLIFLALHT